MCYIRGFIWYVNTTFSLNYGTGSCWDVVRILRTIQFCKTAFLVIKTSEFSRLIARLLSPKAFWVTFVKVSVWEITLSNPTEGTKIAAKWSYQWNTDLLVHQASVDGKFVGKKVVFLSYSSTILGPPSPFLLKTAIGMGQLSQMTKNILEFNDT